MFTIKVKENEKVLLYKNEKLVKVLGVGVYRGFFPFTNYKVERYDISLYGIMNEKAKRVLKMYPELIKKHFSVVELDAHERAYVYIDGKLKEFLEAGCIKIYWKEYTIRVEKVDVQSTYLVDNKYTPYMKELLTDRQIKQVTIDKNEKGYLYIDEVLIKELDAGKYFYYKNFYSLEVKMVQTRVQELEITGQELLSADKVTLRCNVTMHYKIIDGVKYLNIVDLSQMYLYKQLQFAVREHLGSIKIDEILENQHTLSQDILEKFKRLCLTLGVEVEGVHIKDIILPGEMREIFNQVIEASKRAEANNIKRREETASTRSLLNTAKLMKDNPALARLKELEALEKITSTIGTLNVYGGLEGVMNGLVDLKGNVKI